ncbi:hypothetical protein IW261DRAFT_1596306 [Armillaria novae-zelandiae]|uniref:Uncharacterized protein n=1 Tax=Armillaria novae-zelandiae TaxID=153914 RepID=A0AA39NXK2_9AGAR|nr:hypothetical protein IW261DRAFT_1596306 [Armillaria novae-zelandiae]
MLLCQLHSLQALRPLMRSLTHRPCSVSSHEEALSYLDADLMAQKENTIGIDVSIGSTQNVVPIYSNIYAGILYTSSYDETSSVDFKPDKNSARHAKGRKSCLSNRYEQLKVEETSDEDSTEETEPVKHWKIPKEKPSRKKKAKKPVVKPLANAFSHCMEKLIHGNSKESTSQHYHTSHQGSICPLDQIPPQSFLGNALNLKKDKTSCQKAQLKTKKRKKKYPSDSSSSLSSSSSGDDSDTESTTSLSLSSSDSTSPWACPAVNKDHIHLGMVMGTSLRMEGITMAMFPLP